MDIQKSETVLDSIMEKLICKICNKDFNNAGGLNKHTSSQHKDISPVSYYAKYINPLDSGKCKFCGSEAQFKGFTKGFLNICQDQSCVKKSFAPFSKEYKIKIDGLTEDEYADWTKENSRIKKKKTEKSFAQKREADPDFDKKNSRYCKEFWIEKGFSLDESTIFSYNETQKNRDKFKKILTDDPNYMKGKSWVSEEYWINKGYSKEEAKKIVSEKQSTFSLEKCVEKYGEEEGRRKWVERQDKWNKNYKKTNFSKKSQDLFWSIVERFPLVKGLNPSFATYVNGIKDESGINNEVTIKTNRISVKPDFLVGNKIIEFDGVYWHDHKRRNKPENKKREENRDFELKDSGYSILRISELDYDRNKQSTIERCIEFIKV